MMGSIDSHCQQSRHRPSPIPRVTSNTHGIPVLKAPHSLRTSGFMMQYRSANFSIKRSIFWASPGRRKPFKKCLMASSKGMLVKSIWSTYACMTCTAHSTDKQQQQGAGLRHMPQATRGSSTASCARQFLELPHATHPPHLPLLSTPSKAGTSMDTVPGSTMAY